MVHLLFTALCAPAGLAMINRDSLTHVEETDVLDGVDDDEPLAVAVRHQAEVGAQGQAAHLVK